MIHEVGVVVTFEAAHSLRGDFGRASGKHGHTYRVEVAVRGAKLKEDGTVCDLVLLRQAAEGVAEELHYRDLDELDAFSDTNSTAELVAQHFFEQVALTLRGEPIHAVVVRVWESPSAYASCEGTLAEV